MSFLKVLNDVYDQNEHLVGQVALRGKDANIPYMLLPIFHKTQKAHIEVTISESGDFLTATILDQGVTVIPATLDSMSRTSGISPHSIHDKLIYLDPNYGGYLSKSKEKTPEYFSSYLNNLKSWLDSSFSHPFLESVYKYVSKATLISDLLEKEQLLIQDENGHFLDKWKGEKEDKPRIFNVITKDQTDVFVRFRVMTTNGDIIDPWDDPTLWQSHIDYQYNTITDFGLCYVTGEETKLTTKHPGYIRNASDQAKLISTPKNKNRITYQGLFSNPSQAVGIGVEVSLKAHNALKWLIEKQGYQMGEAYCVVFGNGQKSPDLFLTELDELFLEDNEEELLNRRDTTEEVLAHKLKALTFGYKKQLPEMGNQVNILCLESSTTGRLAITNYIQLDPQRYYEKLMKWQVSASWPHRAKGKTYVGSPSVHTIIKAAYGDRVKNGLYQKTVKRLIPCILNGQPIPADILSTLIYRSIKQYNKKNRYQKHQAINVACALLKHNQGGEIKVDLDTEITNRSYLFGRLLAIAECLEGSLTKWSRETNAEKLMQALYHTPSSTWTRLRFKLQPYLHKRTEYIGFQIKCKRMMEEIVSTLGTDFNDHALSPEFLVGYNHQKQAFFKKDKNENTTEMGEMNHAITEEN